MLLGDSLNKSYPNLNSDDKALTQKKLTIHALFSMSESKTARAFVDKIISKNELITDNINKITLQKNKKAPTLFNPKKIKEILTAHIKIESAPNACIKRIKRIRYFKCCICLKIFTDLSCLYSLCNERIN